MSDDREHLTTLERLQQWEFAADIINGCAPNTIEAGLLADLRVTIARYEALLKFRAN